MAQINNYTREAQLLPFAQSPGRIRLQDVPARMEGNIETGAIPSTLRQTLVEGVK